MSFTAGKGLMAQNVTFKASAPSSVVMGTRFNLSFSVNVHNSTELRVPNEVSENFDVLMGPSTSTNSQISFVNGKQSSSVSTTTTYVLLPKKEGSFKIGAASIKIGNSEYKSNELTISVLSSDDTSQQSGEGQQSQQGSQSNNAAASVSGNDVFLRLNISKNSVYEQEGFLVTVKLYTTTDISGVNNVKFPEFEGFLAQDIEQSDAQWKLEKYNGRNYNTAVMKQTVLYPQRSGKLTIGSAKVQAVIRIRNQSRGRSLFEDFFDTYQDVARDLSTQPVNIDVKPLPTGKPVSFSGAVGEFSMTSDINKTNLKTNEAVTLKITIKGNGNIKLIKNPDVVFPNDFETYDPKPENNFKVSTSGSSGTKTIEYMAIPRFAGDFEIPAVSFSYFDTKSESYKTLSTEAYKLHVEKGDGSSESAPVVSNYTNRESVKLLGQDIRYIKVNKVNFIIDNELFFGSFIYVMAYVMIAILFIVFFVIYRKQVQENANIALVRTKKANKTAIKRLKQAEKLLKENEEEAFYEELLRALWGYLSDKLNMPQSELTKDNVASELTKYGVAEELVKEFLEIINTCEFARFAPAESSGAMDKLFNETVDAIGNMENTIKK
jgi:hypothetical protein